MSVVHNKEHVYLFDFFIIKEYVYFFMFVDVVIGKCQAGQWNCMSIDQSSYLAPYYTSEISAGMVCILKHIFAAIIPRKWLFKKRERK